MTKSESPSSASGPVAKVNIVPASKSKSASLVPGSIYEGDSRELMTRLPEASIDLSFWSPPYFVGKEYERDLDFDGWQNLIRTVLGEHARCLKPGGFVAINIADILAFKDPEMPRIQANTMNMRKCSITKEEILAFKEEHPGLKRREIAKHFGVSEQTIQRRVEGNNVRGGKYEAQTKVLLTGGDLQRWGEEAGLYLYDRRIWAKDPAWANSQWHSLSYRAVDEFEYVYIFWKPGVTEVDRARLDREEWALWGSRGVWSIPSVRSNDDHEAQFPQELARRVIRLLSDDGDVVLDPFLGSGTTALVAQREGRQWIGFERDRDYCKLAAKKISGAAG